MDKKFNPDKRNFLKMASLATVGLFTSKLEAATKPFDPSTIKGFFVESNLVEAKETKEPLTLHIKANFETATTNFMDRNAEKEVEHTINVFLAKAELSGTDLMTAEIEVIGTYSEEREWEGNREIAEARMNMGTKILMRSLAVAGYTEDQIARMNIKQSSGGKSINDVYTKKELEIMNEAQTQAAIDGCQGFDIKITAAPKSPEKQKEASREVKIEDCKVVFIDASPSMNKQKAIVLAELQAVNQERKPNEKIATVEIQGSQENHLAVLLDYLENKFKPLVTDGRTIFYVITDEPDNSLLPGSYARKVGDVVGIANNKRVDIMVKILNPDASVGGYKLYRLNDNKNKNILLAKVGYTEGPDTKEWYNNLPS